MALAKTVAVERTNLTRSRRVARQPEMHPVLELQRLVGNAAVTGLVGGGPHTAEGHLDRGLSVQRWSPKKSLRAFGNKVRTFFGKADQPKQSKTGSETLDKMTPSEQSEHAKKTVGSLGGGEPDWADPALAGAPAERFVVTLAVAQEDPSWMSNVDALRRAALKKVVTSPREVIKAAGSGEIQGYLGGAALESKGPLPEDEKEQEQLVEKFTDSIHDVGHTWVRFQTYAGGGKLQSLYSYGMWPQKTFDPESGESAGGYAGFTSAGAGQIRHPDTAHEGDSMKAYKDFTVNEKNFKKALEQAQGLYKSPPPYVLIGYNCTAFAREIIQTAGGSYPGKGLLPGVGYTPGNLYWSIMKDWAKGKKDVRTNDPHQELTNQITGETKKRAKGAQEESVREFHHGRGDYDPNAPHHDVTLYGGHEISMETSPGVLSPKRPLAKSIDVEAVIDEPFIKRFNVVPIVWNSNDYFVPFEQFETASAGPPKGLKPKNYPPGKYNFSSVTKTPVPLKVASSEDGPIDQDLVVDPSVGVARALVFEDLTNRTQRGRIDYNGRVYYAALTSLASIFGWPGAPAPPPVVEALTPPPLPPRPSTDSPPPLPPRPSTSQSPPPLPERPSRPRSMSAPLSSPRSMDESLNSSNSEVSGEHEPGTDLESEGNGPEVEHNEDAPPNLSHEERQVGEREAYAAIDDVAMQIIDQSHDVTTGVEYGMVEASAIDGLSPSARAYLAERLGISLKLVNEQIARLKTNA